MREKGSLLQILCHWGCDRCKSAGRAVVLKAREPVVEFPVRRPEAGDVDILVDSLPEAVQCLRGSFAYSRLAVISAASH